MEITTELLKFNIKNLNNREYRKSSFEDINFEDEEYYGQIGQDSDLCVENYTHIVRNVRIDNKGKSLIGEVELLDNSLSEFIKDNIDNYVFRPRILGHIEGDIVKVQSILSFDAIPCVEDSWFGMEEKIDHYDINSLSLITNNFKEFLKEENSLDILNRFMFYNLDRANPNYYGDIENEEISEEDLKSIIYHKECHDDAMLVLISNTIEIKRLVSLVNKMISHYEEYEIYEYCSLLNNYLIEFKKEVDYNE